MRFVSVGGGPAGLFFAILMKEADPAHEILVLERNRPDDTFGFGVVFSDATMAEIGEAEPRAYEEIRQRFYHWDDIDIHYRGEVLSSTGHGFAGLSRQTLLRILQERCVELGVDLRFEAEVEDLRPYADADLILAADGVNSRIRSEYAEPLGPTVDLRPNRFVWLGTTKPFPAFTFYFKPTDAGLWRVHAYQYAEEESAEAERLNGISTFIVETTEETWRAAGMDRASEEETLRFCEGLFTDELDGHPLIGNLSVWRSFPTVTCDRWHHGNIVLVGDAAHTAHFSVGSGTRLAMIDAIELSRSIGRHRGDIARALQEYEEARRPAVASLQRAAKTSMLWFEGTERYMDDEPIQFAFNLLTRSLRITHENLRARDPAFLERVDAWFARTAAGQSGVDVPTAPPPPPLFTPFRVRGLLLPNRVAVSPMCQYSAEEGMPNDWHLVHLGSRAVGGAGLVFTEMTDVSPEARISPGCTGMYRPEHVGAWARIVDFIHRHSEAKVAIQLGHAGRKGSTRLAWEGMDEPLREGNWPIVSASPIPYFPHSQVPREMTREDMNAVRAAFVRAAGMSEEAGFDWLEIHLAHGYLFASFISPLTNTRTDAYGGSLDNRMRYPLEVLDAVREAWPDKPLSVRISAVDWAPGGLEADDAVEVARMLGAHGVDIVDVSAGQTVAHAKPEYGRQFQTPFSDRIRHEAGIATMAVGNISSYMDVNTILAAGRADLCLMARAHLWDPYWTRHMAYELGYALPWPDPYATLDDFTPRLGLKEEDK
ncbi:MAG: bifunctional salicylyl-CoA 5-hydroxylase/oxidoreductase [Gemmatimonadota bacterium]|nr:MAG: bifunctional salicylyl-CoA 5-hydroxylase/oxidoreductase [Gemmatimonadota bacterium]